MKKLLTSFIVLAFLAGGGYAASRWYRNLSDTAVKVARDIPRARLERRDLVDEVEVVGQIKARESDILSAPYNGKLRRLIPEGTFVEAGDVVAEMETTEIEDNLVEEQVNLELRKSEYEQRKAEYDLLLQQHELDRASGDAQVEYNTVVLSDSQRKFEEQQKLVERNLASQSTLEASRLDLLQAELNLKEAQISVRKTKESQQSAIVSKRADIDKAKINVDKIEKNLREEQQKLVDAEIRATRSGFVSYMYTWRGKRAKVAEGDQVWSRNGIIEIPDSSQMEVTVPVNELDITRVAPNQRVTIRVAAIPDEVFGGLVARKTSVPLSASNNPFGEGREGVKEFEVFLSFDKQDDRFRQSMTATSVIEVAQAKGALAAPLDAVFKREGSGENDKETKYVIVERGGEVVEVDVTLGVVGQNFAELVPVEEGALAEGDELLLRDPRLPLS